MEIFSHHPDVELSILLISIVFSINQDFNFEKGGYAEYLEGLSLYRFVIQN